MQKPVGGGLSGEHIQLCAEGARLKSRISQANGQRRKMLKFSRSSPCVGCFFVFKKMERGNMYAQQTYGFYWICESV